MSFIDNIFKTPKTITELSTDMLTDIFKAFQGDKTAIGKIVYTLTQMSLSIHDWLFWSKIAQFLDGVYLNETDCSKLRAKLAECDKEEENIYRLIAYIDRAESKKKIRYLINATRCLLADFIDLASYFRICNAVTYTLEEDLQYLREHISEENIDYNVNTQGLSSSGLMYQSMIEVSGRQLFSFTPIGKMVDQYAVSYDDDMRYPNPSIQPVTNNIPKTNLPLQEVGSIKKGEIDSLF